jgi:Na+-driven multidrug efflux pump
MNTVTVGTLVAMASIGVGASILEKVLSATGKVTEATYVSIVGMSGIAIPAVYAMVKLIQAVATLG